MTDTHKKLAEKVAERNIPPTHPDFRSLVSDIIAALASEFTRGRAQGAHEARNEALQDAREAIRQLKLKAQDESMYGTAYNYQTAMDAIDHLLAPSAYPKPDADKL